jgi:hypothetical protein
MVRITSEYAERLIKSSNGSIFSVNFIKANGESRDMTCRLGVSKGITGNGMSYDPSAFSLLPVFDMAKQDYRMIRLDSVRRLTIDGHTYAVVQ